MLFLREFYLQPDGKLHISFLDVGQGDSVLIQTPFGAHILIDGGPDLSTLEHLGKFLPFFKKTIEYIVLSHPDSDHLSSLPEVLNRYRVRYLLLAGSKKEESRYKKLLHVANEKNVSVLLLKNDMALNTGDGVFLEVIYPLDITSMETDDVNNQSVVLRINFKDISILFPGDIEETAENEILASGADISSYLLKVPHHGSRTSSSTGFLLAVSPNVAIVSSGKENNFGHPHPEILDRYERMHISIRNTAREGTISYVFP